MGYDHYQLKATSSTLSAVFQRSSSYPNPNNFRD